MRDDRDANRLVTVETYRLDADSLRRGKLLLKFPVKASSLEAYDKVPAGKRRTPYQLHAQVNREQTIVLVTPGHRPPAPASVALDGTAFRYALDVVRNADTLTLDYHLAGRDDDVAKAAETPDVASDASRVSDDNYWYLDLTSTAGGTIGDQSAPWWRTFALTLLAIFVTVVLLGAAVFSLRHGLGADDGYSGDGFFYPVRPAKFLLMGLATAGLYAVFWMWKCWRWRQRHGTPAIMPFWRAIFGVFWLHPLFRAVAERGAVSLPLRLAAAFASFAYPMSALGCAVLGADPRYTVAAVLLNALSFIWVLPVVIAVNRLNRAEILAANSRFTDLTGLAAAGGLLTWALILVPALALGPWKALGIL